MHIKMLKLVLVLVLWMVSQDLDTRAIAPAMVSTKIGESPTALMGSDIQHWSTDSFIHVKLLVNVKLTSQ